MKSKAKAPERLQPTNSTGTLSSTAQMLQILVQSVRDYAIILLDPDGVVLTWNTGAELIKGWKSEEIVGQHFSRFYPPEEAAKGRAQQELKAAAETGRYEDEGWRMRKDGSRFWANVVVTALRDPNGQLLGFGKLTRDVSERRKAEELLRQQSQEIQETATVPLVQVWEGIVLVPIIGTLNSQRTQQLMEKLLHRVTETNSPLAILDITGVPTIDTQTAQHLIETISAVRLLGAEVVLTGVRPVIAQTLVHLGIDLSNVITRSSLSAGLRLALNRLDLDVQMKTLKSVVTETA